MGETRTLISVGQLCVHSNSRYDFRCWAQVFKDAGALNHSKRNCPLGKECVSEGQTRLIETLFYTMDGRLIEATDEQIMAWTKSYLSYLFDKFTKFLF